MIIFKKISWYCWDKFKILKVFATMFRSQNSQPRKTKRERTIGGERDQGGCLEGEVNGSVPSSQPSNYAHGPRTQ